jgi:hypothetical protein
MYEERILEPRAIPSAIQDEYQNGGDRPLSWMGFFRVRI